MSSASTTSPSVLVREAPPSAESHQGSSAAALETALEPSMEEILASIRKIIADDHGVAARATPAAAAPAPSPPKRTAPLWAPLSSSFTPSAPRSQTRIEPSLRVEPVPAPAAVAPPPPSPAPPAPRFVAEPLPPEEVVAPEPDHHLAPALAEHDPEPHQIEPLFEDPIIMPVDAAEPQPVLEAKPAENLLSPASQARVASSLQSLATTVMMQNTKMIESTIRDMLRPMLKDWLDDNLPPIVERVVRDEIERVARGA